MRFVGIDVAAESHVFAILGEDGAVLARPTPFAEDAEGHAKLLQALAGGPVLVVILDACCSAWNALLAETGRIRSLCSLDWATPVTS